MQELGTECDCDRFFWMQETTSFIRSFATCSATHTHSLPIVLFAYLYFLPGGLPPTLLDSFTHSLSECYFPHNYLNVYTFVIETSLTFLFPAGSSPGQRRHHERHLYFQPFQRRRGQGRH